MISTSVLPGRASRPEPGPARLGLAQLGPSLLYISLKLGLGLHTQSKVGRGR